MNTNIKIIISISFIAFGFFVAGLVHYYQSQNQILVELNSGEVLTQEEYQERLESIYFDHESKVWKDNTGECDSCLPRNGFGLDGIRMEEMEYKMCFAIRERFFGSETGVENYSYYFTQVYFGKDQKGAEMIFGKNESYQDGGSRMYSEFTGSLFVDGDYLVLNSFETENQDPSLKESILRFSGNALFYGAASPHNLYKDEFGFMKIKDPEKLHYSDPIISVSCAVHDSLYEEYFDRYYLANLL